MILKTSNQILSQAKASLTSIDVVASAIIGFALGMVFSVGRSFYGSLGLMSFKDSWLWIRGFCYGCAAAIAIAAILVLWNWYQDGHKGIEVSPSRFSLWLTNLTAYKRVALFGITIFVLWIPAFLAFYPGNYSSDGPIQATYLLK